MSTSANTTGRHVDRETGKKSFGDSCTQGHGERAQRGLALSWGRGKKAEPIRIEGFDATSAPDGR
eukprot:4087309-Pleurochrysis_carterae.AAC.1